jgi:glycosyltransferase involved in cell wall biosynthesis
MPLKVSVVTPSYNQASFLEETMLSVLSQDYEPIEYIVIDGGSEDRSVEIIRKYSGRLAYWISESDSGQSDAINKGWSGCKGDIICYLNSDDYFLPGAIRTAVKAFEENPRAGLICGRANAVFEDGQFLRTCYPRALGQEMLEHLVGLPQPSVFLRKRVLERVGLLDPALHLVFDADFFLRVLGNFEAVCLSQSLSCMRRHATAKSVAQGTHFAGEVIRLAERVASQPDRYPRFHIEPARVLSAGYEVAAHFSYVHGDYASALRHLKRSWGLSGAHRRRIVCEELPRLLLRALVGSQRYLWLSRYAGSWNDGWGARKNHRL